MTLVPDPDAPFAALVWAADNAKGNPPVRHGRAKRGAWRDGCQCDACQCDACREYRNQPGTRRRRQGQLRRLRK